MLGLIVHNYIAIVGPTASGKSALAMELAKKHQGEIVSCDSVQIYQGFNIGSAKPTLQEQAEVPHHLLDCASWQEPYDAARYGKDARKVITDIQNRNKLPIVVGGTGLYLRALWGYGFNDLPTDSELKAQLSTLTAEALYQKLQELDPQRASQLHPHDKFRLIRACEVATLTGSSLATLSKQETSIFAPDQVIMCSSPDKAKREERIRLRTELMLREGLIAETQNLLAQGCDPNCKPMQTIGYKQVVAYLQGEIKAKDLSERIVIATRQYARKQLMWFRQVEVNTIVDMDSNLNPINSMKFLRK
jgi:tRNA dimethylallyltransferase